MAGALAGLAALVCVAGCFRMGYCIARTDAAYCYGDGGGAMEWLRRTHRAAALVAVATVAFGALAWGVA